MPPVRLEKILPNRYSREIGLAFQSSPRVVGPGDVPVGIDYRDRATLQVKGVLDQLPVGHPGSVRPLCIPSK